MYAGGVGKTYKLKKKNKEYSQLLRGSVNIKEYSGVTNTSEQTVFVGHANYGFGLLLKSFARALVKMILNRNGITFEAFTDQVLVGMIGDIIRIRHKDSYLAGAPTNANFTIGAGIYDLIADQIVGHLISKTNQYQMFDISYVPAVGSGFKFVNIHMKNAKVSISSVSEFVIQNRTQSKLDDDEVEKIDNQPVRVKAYLGYGNGTQIAGSQSIGQPEFVAGENNGVIDIVPILQQNDQQEPPNARYFAQCYAQGSFILDPGQSKTSALYHSSTYTQSSFFAKALYGNLGNWNYTLMKLGKHKIFCVEKLIDCVAAQPDVSVGFEHNLKIGCVIKPGYNTYTSAFFNKQYK